MASSLGLDEGSQSQRTATLWLVRLEGGIVGKPNWVCLVKSKHTNNLATYPIGPKSWLSVGGYLRRRHVNRKHTVRAALRLG
jgi:hypothetical protein